MEYIKIDVDTHKQRGDFWLTGSQAFHMMKKVSETLAGRVGILRMPGLSNSEINGYSLPPFEVDPDMLIHRLPYESYLETYISRDIRDWTQGADEMTFSRFSAIVAARTAANVNYEVLENETGIPAPTAKQWLPMLVSSGLVLLVEPYFNNALKRVIKAPRMFFLDTGLCSCLTRWNSAEALETGAVICLASDILPIDSKSWYVPVWLI